MDRATFLAAVERRAHQLADPSCAPGWTGTLSDLALQHAHEEADQLLAAAREYADQVDRAGLTDYSRGVVVFGSQGPAVMLVEQYDADRVAAEARAGEVDLVLQGLVLLGWAPAQVQR